VLSRLNESTSAQTYTQLDLAKGNFIHTLSVVFRNAIAGRMPHWFEESPIGDYVLHMLNASYGKIYYMPDPMGVYRKFIGIYGTQNATTKVVNNCKTLSLLIDHFHDEEILQRLRWQKAVSLAYLYKHNAIDEVNKQEPLVKQVLDVTTIKSTDDLSKLSARFLFFGLCKRILSMVRHNPIGNKINSFLKG
jgi:hypothetical protein